MPDLIVGFDTEYRTQHADDHIWEPGPKDNIELVRTACIMEPDTGRYETLAHYPTGPTRRHRTSMTSFLGACLLTAVEAGLIEKSADRKYSVQLAAHFSRADLPSFRDWSKIKKRFDSVRGTFCTMTHPAVFSFQVPKLGLVRVSVTLIDTILHAPASHRSLAKLGDVLGFQKIELPPGTIERMDQLLLEDPLLFEEYAIRDAVLAAMLVREMDIFYRETLDVQGTRFPVTLSSAGVRMFKNTIAKDGYSLQDFLGQDDEGNPWLETGICNQLGADAFHGGRNEAFYVGPTPEGILVHDVDLAGAYSTIFAAFRMPDWKRFRQTTATKDLTQLDDGMSFATIRFSFPNDTRFPSLPVRHKDGLFYPLRGETTVTGAELIVALAQEAEIEVLSGVVIPWTGDYRPLLAFTQRIQDIRRQAERGGLKERAAKEAGNSLYGKFAQAVAGMRMDGRAPSTFDSRTGRDQVLPPSSITQPCIAAWITGICRAVVSEMLARLPATAIVCSVTTDGLLSSVPLEDMDLSGPLCSYFADLREMAAPGAGTYEIKHVVRRAFILRTRGALTIEPLGSRDEVGPMTARSGNRLSDEVSRNIVETTSDPISAAWAENDTLLEQAATRVYGQKSTQRRKVTLKEQWQRETDLTMTGEPIEVALSMDFDFKRQIVDPRDDWRGCLSASTKPWNTLADATAARHAYRLWRKTKRMVLRTIDDFRSLENELSSITGRPAEMLPARDKFAYAIRIAAANGLFGFSMPAKGRGTRGQAGGYRTLAEALTNCGIPTSRDQLNRVRGKSFPEDVKFRSEHSAVMDRLRTHFPEVEWNAIAGFGPSDLVDSGSINEHCQKSVRIQGNRKPSLNQIVDDGETKVCGTPYPPSRKAHTSRRDTPRDSALNVTISPIQSQIGNSDVTRDPNEPR